MAFQEDKNILIEYMENQKIFDSDDERELENFFNFIDELEEKSKSEPQYFSLLAEAYMKVGNVLKAKEAFSKIYHLKNKKDLKKLVSYDTAKVSPIVRPSERAKNLPPFRYVDKRMLKNKFIVSNECSCSICRKQSAALYIGMAYIENSDKINFMKQEDKFCADCISNGTAAAELGLKFNSPALEECIAIDSEKLNELLYKTPECSDEFDFDEDIWPLCCGDFCRYTGFENEYEEKFYFQCIHCKKTVVWTKWT